MPKISVIMPLYNAERYIRKSIESILNQTFSDFELIIVNDGSTDNSAAIVESIHDSRIHLYHNERNEGIAYTRNKCIDLAQGEYLALMDDDDIAELSRFEIEGQYLDENKEIDVVGSNYSVINNKGEIVYTNSEPLRNPNYIRAYLMLYDAVANGSAMVRREFIESNHIRYDNNCYGMEDYKFWINCSLHGTITNINKVLFYWRNHNANETNRIKDSLLEQSTKKLAEIRQYAFEGNNYELTSEDYFVLNNMLPRNITTVLGNKYEMEKLYEVLKKIIMQAQDIHAPNSKEVSIFCKKMFAKRVEYSKIWELE